MLHVCTLDPRLLGNHHEHPPCKLPDQPWLDAMYSVQVLLQQASCLEELLLTHVALLFMLLLSVLRHVGWVEELGVADVALDQMSLAHVSLDFSCGCELPAAFRTLLSSVNIVNVLFQVLEGAVTVAAAM